MLPNRKRKGSITSVILNQHLSEECFKDDQNRWCQFIILASLCGYLTSTIVALKQSCIKQSMRRHRIYHTKQASTYINFKHHKQHVNRVPISSWLIW
jgi:hypothetical protein